MHTTLENAASLWKRMILSRKDFYLNKSSLSFYCKIPKISPGAYIFQRPFLRGLFLEGLMFGGTYLQRESCVLTSIGLVL